MEIEKIAADRYRLRAHGQLITLSAQDLRDVYDFALRWMKQLEQEAIEADQPSYDDIHTVEAYRREYDEGQKIAEYNKMMTDRDRLIRESIPKPWLPLHDGE